LREDIAFGAVPAGLAWQPGDVDVFLPFGASQHASQDDRRRSEAVWEIVIAHVKRLLPLLYSPSEHHAIPRVKSSNMYDDPDTFIGPPDSAFWGGLSGPDGEWVDDEDDEVMEAKSEATQPEELPLVPNEEEHKIVEALSFEEPENPIQARTYSRARLRQLARGEPPFAGAGEGAHRVLAKLEAHGLLDGNQTDVLGLPRAYKVGRVANIEVVLEGLSHGDDLAYSSFEVERMEWATFFTSNRGPTLESFSTRPWRLPATINLVQYHGEPLDPLGAPRLEQMYFACTHAPRVPAALIGTFDLMPPRVAIGVEPGSARHRFTLAAETAQTIATRELGLTKFTWGPCYLNSVHNPDHDDEPDEPEDRQLHMAMLRGPVRTQLKRIMKYEYRGFKLPGAEDGLVARHHMVDL
jgi:hypothetical protein